MKKEDRKVKNNKYEEFVREEQEGDGEEIAPMYKWLVTIGGILATFVIVGIASFMLFFRPGAENAKFIAVPDVRGKTVEEAKALVEKDKLIIEVVEEQATDEALPGIIIKQTPGTEEKIKQEGTIEVVVAKGAEGEEAQEVEVPEMVGIDAAEAQRMLQDRKLLAKVERIFDDEVEMGKVISQFPEANSKAKEGDLVTLTISDGPEKRLTAVPNLLSLTQEAATKSLKRAKLTLGKVTEQASDTVEKGLVIEQSIQENTEIEQGAAVNIVISTGKKEEVPTEPEKPVDPANPGDNGTTEPPKETKTYTINLPQNSDKEEYHVFVTLENNQGTTNTIYDGIVKKDQFPFNVTAEGSGDGIIVTRIDGKDVYRDPF